MVIGKSITVPYLPCHILDGQVINNLLYTRTCTPILASKS